MIYSNEQMYTDNLKNKYVDVFVVYNAFVYL